MSVIHTAYLIREFKTLNIKSFVKDNVKFTFPSRAKPQTSLWANIVPK